MQKNISTFEYSSAGWHDIRGAGVIHAGSRRGYLKKNFRIELCMVEKGFGDRQYQKNNSGFKSQKGLVPSQHIDFPLHKLWVFFVISG